MALTITRRTALAVAATSTVAPAFARRKSGSIEQWGLFELALKGPTSGNPFLDTELTATFEGPGKTVTATGFYDGEGVYRIRFMPDAPGHWQYTTKSNTAALNGKSGAFEATPPSPRNHGPVHVVNRFHFAYADGTPYRQLGTTCYPWTLQPDAQCELTLKTLATSPFNKMRMALFPNSTVPALPIHAFEGKPKAWDYTRFNPAFFQRFDKYVARLLQLGIEADVILFHPYDGDKWDYDKMPAEVDDRYTRYVVARLAAYRNVWWSMANEYDLMKHKTDADFDRLFQVVRKADPYDRLRSIHNCFEIYDNNKPWVTHASIQNGSALEDDGRAVLYRDVWRKPVVFDEVKYEGNLPQRWGNISGEEMVKRFWMGTIAGSYVGHSECLRSKETDFWLAEGGLLKGTSPGRLAFYKKIWEEGPAEIEPIDKWEERHMGGVPGKYYLRYFGDQTPTNWPFVLPKQDINEGDRFTVDIIDTWNMTVTPVPGAITVKKSGNYDFAADRVVDLPGKPYILLRIRRV